jgi:hypothetical protein
MKVRPLFYLQSLSEDELERHACSDRLWLPQSDFERYMLAADTDSVVTLRLKGGRGAVVGAVYGAHFDDPDVVYVPYWMYERLGAEGVEDEVEVERFFPLLGTSVTLLPHTSDYLALGDDPQETLREGFEQYTCLTRGETYDIWLGAFSFKVTLQDLTPDETNVILIRNRTLGLHILPPLDAPLPMPPTAAPAPAPASVTTVPAAAPAPAAQEPTQDAETRRRQIAEATRRRLGLSAKPSE